MGYYIECEKPLRKAEQIIAEHGGQLSTMFDYRAAMDDPTKGVVVVVNNGLFEAAGFCFDMEEFKAFTLSDDTRLKQFVIMDRQKAEELSGYAKRRNR